MFPSRTISLAIASPYDDVYAFLSNPSNLSRWTAGVLHAPVEPVTDLVWRTVHDGQTVGLEFSPVNAFGVLDLAVTNSRLGDRRYWIRVFPNENGTELCCTILQRPGEDDAGFQSEVDWLRTDLMVLKSFIEAR